MSTQKKDKRGKREKRETHNPTCLSTHFIYTIDEKTLPTQPPKKKKRQQEERAPIYINSLHKF